MKRNKLLYSLLIPSIAASILLSCGGNAPKERDSFDIIRDNYNEMIFNATSTKSYEEKTINEIKANMLPKKILGRDTYYFSDIDYSLDQDRSNWPAGSHLSRCKQIAVLAKKTNNNELKDIALKLLYHWLYSNYRNVNWWQNEIGANGNLTDIAILLFDDLDAKGKDALRGKIRESSIYHRPSLTTHEGSNLINYLDMSLKSSSIDKNKEELAAVQKEMPRIIELSSTSGKIEGFQDDGSFFQHGKQLQTGSYGLEGVGKVGKLVRATFGTGYELPTEKLNIISNFVLEGLSSVAHKGKYSYLSQARTYSRVNAGDIKKSTGFSDLSVFAKLDTLPRKEEFNKFLSDINEEKSNFSGIKVFNDAKVISLNIDDVYMMFKGTDYTMTNTECVNYENRLGYNLSASNNTCVMETGNEYYNISPIWDYNCLPGSTSVTFSSDENIVNYMKEPQLNNSVYENHLPVKFNDNDSCIYNFSNKEQFSKDKVAFSMCKTAKDALTDTITKEQIDDTGMKFNISCFATSDGMVILGSGFTIATQNENILKKYTKNNDVNLTTTVEQNIVNEGITPKISSNNKVVTNGKVKYTALGENDTLDLEVKKQSGTWQRNNPSLTTPSEVVEKNIMSVKYNKNAGQSYAYSIQPTNNNKEFKVAVNNESIQAIELPGENKIAACFYNKDATFDYESKTYSLQDKSQFKNGKGAFVIIDKQ